jgi:hypothetical protein
MQNEEQGKPWRVSNLSMVDFQGILNLDYDQKKIPILANPNPKP